MGKIKSAICLVLTTLVIVALGFICFVSFDYGENGMHRFDSVISVIDKDANFGAEYGANGSYRGGGYSATFYPEGVITANEFDENCKAKTGDDLADYKEKYAIPEEYPDLCEAYPNLRFEKEKALDGDKISAEFADKFAYAKDRLTARYTRMNITDLRVDVADDYTLHVFVPQSTGTANAYTATFDLFSQMGDLDILYGSSEDTATSILRADETIGDYVKSAGTAVDTNGTHFVTVRLTSLGKKTLASKTQGLSADSTGSIIFRIGGENVIPAISVSSPITNGVISFGNSSFDGVTATALATLIEETATCGVSIEGSFSLSADHVVVEPALYGENATFYLYIAFGVLFVAMMAFFFARYGLLAFVHLYTYLIFLLVTILCMWAISFVTLSAATFAAILLSSLLLSVSQVFVYEEARKEYKTGKTIAACVKNAYKKCLWHIFDLHIIVAGVAFILYAIAFSQLAAFGFMLGLTAVFSGIASLALGRFFWAIMMSFTEKPGKFCNFKREEVEDND